MNCGACHQPATIRLKSGLLRCRPCWESLHLPGEPDVIEAVPVVPHEQATVDRGSSVGELARDYKRKSAGEAA